MQLEVGKYYRTRDGRKVGPMDNFGCLEGGLAEKFGDGRMWNFSGAIVHSDTMSDNDDIIAEWTDEPTQNTQPILSSHTIDHIAMDSLRYHYATEMEPLQKEAFRIVLRYYGVTV